MVFEGKELRDIRIEDVQFLIDNQIVEDTSIEYKSQMWERTDKGTREMLRDISSIANARGGHFVLGIREDKEEEGLPKDIVGISDADKALQRIMSVCLSCIDEKIRSLDVISISFKGDRHVVVVRIPRSTRIPHIITFKNLYQCWRRHGRQKNIMSIDEIREACLRVESLRKDLEEFIEERKDKIIRNAPGEPSLLIAATPIVVKEDIIDVFDQGLKKLLESPPTMKKAKGFNLDCCGRDDALRPTLYGIKAERPDWRSIEILRNGYIEFIVLNLAQCDEQRTKNERVFRDRAIVEYLVNFMYFLKDFLAYTSIFEPVVISVALINSNDIGMFEHGIYGGIAFGFQEGEVRIWKEGQHLVLPSMQVNFIDNPQQTAKVFADRIWNAFGFEKAPHFDENGNYIPPRRD